MSDDHSLSNEPGIIPQITGILTSYKYIGAVIIVDHHSNLPFVYLLESISDEGTVRAKVAFEQKTRAHRVTIMHYHANNLRFNSPSFQLACHQLNQTHIYCGVGSHQQNGIAKAKICDLTNGAQALLLHTQRRWHSITKACLWPNALSAVCH